MKEIYIYDNAGTSNVQIHDHDSDVGYWCSPPLQGFESPSTRISVIERGGEHGAYMASALYGARAITLEGTVHGDTVATFEDRRRDLQNILHIERDSYGIPKLKTLKFTTQDDLELQCAVNVASPLLMNKVNILHARFQINLVAPEYTLEAQTATTQNFTTPTATGFTWPFVWPVTWGTSSGAAHVLTNNGNGYAYPTITFTGPLTNPRLLNTTTGEEMALTQTILSGQVVVITMRDRTIVQDGSINRISLKTAPSTWWALVPGANSLNFGTSSSSDIGTCTVSFRDAYVGI